VIRLLAELGVRPVELLHLSVRTDPKTKQSYWWCSYEKRAGGGVTKPRRLQEMPLRDEEGIQQQWDLKDRWKGQKIELPPLGMRNGAAEAVANYLDRQAGWQSLRSEMAAKGERLTPYSFRHGYSLRCHAARTIPVGDIALVMGHSLAVHCSSYPWAHEEGAAASFERARTPAMTGIAMP
jgi:integrase